MNHPKTKVAKGKILIADDNQINQQLLTYQQNEPNIELIFASNGSEAIHLLANNKDIRLVLMDNNHGPFSWGTDAANAVHNAKVMEEVANMAHLSFTLNSDAEINQFVLDKHYSRKHGMNAYYGQKKL